MKTIIRFIFLLSLAFLVNGCASTGYWRDRGRDVADIFTATIGAGAGIKARVGPIQPAFLITHDIMGLRCGEFFLSQMDETQNFEIFCFVPIDETSGSLGEAYFVPGETAKRRNKAIYSYSSWPFIVDEYSEPLDEIIGPATGTVTGLTQLEIVAGLGLTARLGFNGAEFVDFILGWFHIDILGDDLAKQEKEASKF